MSHLLVKGGVLLLAGEDGNQVLHSAVITIRGSESPEPVLTASDSTPAGRQASLFAPECLLWPQKGGSLSFAVGMGPIYLWCLAG